MIPYKTMKFEQWPDVGDIQAEGRKSSVGRSDQKSYNRSAASKAAIRRYLKHRDNRRWMKLEAAAG